MIPHRHVLVYRQVAQHRRSLRRAILGTGRSREKFLMNFCCVDIFFPRLTFVAVTAAGGLFWRLNVAAAAARRTCSKLADDALQRREPLLQRVDISLGRASLLDGPEERAGHVQEPAVLTHPRAWPQQAFRLRL